MGINPAEDGRRGSSYGAGEQFRVGSPRVIPLLVGPGLSHDFWFHVTIGKFSVNSSPVFDPCQGGKG